MLRFLTRKSKGGGEPLFPSYASDKKIESRLSESQSPAATPSHSADGMDQGKSVSNDARPKSPRTADDVPSSKSSEGETDVGELEASRSSKDDPSSDDISAIGPREACANSPSVECGAGPSNRETSGQCQTRSSSDMEGRDDGAEGRPYDDDDIDAVLCITGIAHGGDIVRPVELTADKPVRVKPPKPPRPQSEPEITVDDERNKEKTDDVAGDDFALLKATLSDPNLYSNYAMEQRPLMSQSNLRGNKKGSDLRVSFWDDVARRYGRRHEGWGSEEDCLSVASTVSAMSESDYIPSRLLLRRTCALIIAWLCMGLYTETVSTNLPYVLTKVQQDYGAVAPYLGLRGVAMFLGSILGGVLGDALPDWSDLWIALSLHLAAVFTAAIPWCEDLLCFGITSSGMGIARGTLCSVSLGLLFRIWEDKRAYPVFFILFVAYSIGAAPTAFITYLFDSELDQTSSPKYNVSNDVTSTASVGVDMVAGLIEGPTTKNHTGSDVTDLLTNIPRPMYPFDIAAILSFLVGAVFLVFFGTTMQSIPKYKNEAYERLRKSRLQSLRPSEWFLGSTVPSFRILFYVIVFLVLPQTSMAVYGRWLITILDSGAYDSMPDPFHRVLLQTTFWCACAAGCIVTPLGLRCRLSPNVLIIACYTLLLLATIMFYVYGHRYALSLWVFAGLTGVCASPILPCGLTICNQFLSTSSMGMMIAIGTVALAEGLVGWQCAYIVNYFPAIILLYVAIASAALGFSLYLPLIPALAARRTLGRRRSRAKRATRV